MVFRFHPQERNTTHKINNNVENVSSINSFESDMNPQNNHSLKYEVHVGTFSTHFFHLASL